MLSTSEIRTNLEAIANKLDKSDGNTATLLRDLSYALRGGPQIDSWNVLNIQQVINPALAVERFRSQRVTDRWISSLEWIRNSLIFAPLVLTWLGISTAVSQYKALIEADPNQISQPFIYLWEQGFGNRLPWFFTLGYVAGFDFFLLLLVLAMTITVYSLANLVKLRHEQEANDLNSTLSYTLSCTTLWLTSRGAGQPTNFVDRLTQATQKFEQAVTLLMGQLTTLADRQKDDWKTFDTLKTQLSNVVTTVTSSLVEIKTSNETLSRSVNGLVTPAQNIANQQHILAQNTQQAVTDFQAQTAAQNLVVQELQKWGGSFQSALAKLETTIATNTQLTSATGAFTTKQTDLVAAMERERREQAEISNRVLLATESLKSVVSEIKTCSIELQGLNVQMDQLVRRVAGIR